ncbi:MAG TPA: hypothetical protein VHV10_04925 [Ktedonobacteraceae bacterium]|jgi:hypothetical protein|nr:hypothetical protein [Ktedonobacteraceae bacterium]
MNEIPQSMQDTLEIACKAIEWDEKEVTSEAVAQHIRQHLWHREQPLPSLIKVFVDNWHSPATI